MTDLQLRRDVDKLISFSGQVGGLAEEDVLTVLNEEGITSLRDLVRHALAQPPAAESEALDHHALLRDPAPVPADQLVHRVPQVAVVVDGVEYAPEDIIRFNGVELTFVAGTDQDRLVALTDDRPLRAAAWAAITVHQRATAFTDPRPVTQGEVQMFEHHFYGGDWFWCPAKRGWPDLTRVRHGSWPGSDWNDTISSTGATNCLVYYYEHINYGGIRLYAPPGINIPDMERIGWNDRISSVANLGPIGG